MSNDSEANKKVSVTPASIFQKVKSAFLYIWNRPLALTAVLAVLAIIILNLIVKQSFKSRFNCDYIFSKGLGIPETVCHGFTLGQIPGVSDAASVFNDAVSFFGGGDNTIPSNTTVIPDLSGVVDPALERVRQGVTGVSLLLMGFVSIYLTIIFNNMKSVIKLVSFNKEEWARFLTSIRTWLLIFISFCLLYYIFTPK